MYLLMFVLCAVKWVLNRALNTWQALVKGTKFKAVLAHRVLTVGIFLFFCNRMKK